MQWRNEQIYHLRQKEPLSSEEQDDYFRNVINNIFHSEQPDQLLFSYLEDQACIGYGGLVHINWQDANAEISFIIDTAREEQQFREHWNLFLDLIEEVAFQQLSLHKIYVWAFDLRPKLYSILKGKSYFLDAILKDHVYFNNSFIDVVIYSKMKPC